MRFINPRTDFAFKKIFASQQSKAVLISFLNAILYEGASTIQDLKIIDPYQAPQLKGMKDSYLDVKVTLADQTSVIIEMQVLNVLGFEKRVLYNAAKALSIQLDAGAGYMRLNPVIALTITDFEMFPDSDKVISRYAMKEKESFTTYSNDIELVFVELPKFDKSLNELSDITDRWIYFLKQAESLETVPETWQDTPELERAFKIAELSNLSREELDIFERKQMFLEDSRNAVLKGIEQGIEQGERMKARAIALSLLDVLDVKTISAKTGLSIEEVIALK